ERADQAEREKKPELRMTMGGTGSAQEDQIITIQIEQAIPGVKFNYVPFKGGGEVCVNLVGKHVNTTVNNPIECVSHWKAGRVRPLAVLDRKSTRLNSRHEWSSYAVFCLKKKKKSEKAGRKGGMDMKKLKIPNSKLHKRSKKPETIPMETPKSVQTHETEKQTLIDTTAS